MNIILHLGGNINRAYEAAAIAKALPDCKIVVSSEGDGFYAIYDQEGISRDQIVVDNAAWDTVTNFTHTFSLLKKLNCQRLFVVSDGFHCYRAMLIALSCWGFRCPIYMMPSSIGVQPSDEGLAMGDMLRALLWRCTGILVFSKKVREERQPGYKPSTEHARCEIGF